MRVRIDDIGLFECGERDVYSELRRLFDRASQGQHELELDDPEQVLASDFMKIACAELDRATWEELLLRTPAGAFDPAERSKPYAVVVSEGHGTSQDAAFVLTPNEVGDWAEQPLKVLLENLSDDVLLRLAARLAPESRLQSALNGGWLKPHGCGGTGEVKKAVEAAKPTERLFVIIDSDRNSPDDDDSPIALKIRAICSPSRHIEVHVLRRQELENYVPDAIWEKLIRSNRSPTKNRNNKADEQREILAYQWLVRRIEPHLPEAQRKFGIKATERIMEDLKRKAEREVSQRWLQQRLNEWLSMKPPGLRRVDDLKVRFGEGLAKRAIKALDDSDFDPAWLDDDARQELRDVVALLEKWL